MEDVAEINMLIVLIILVDIIADVRLVIFSKITV